MHSNAEPLCYTLKHTARPRAERSARCTIYFEERQVAKEKARANAKGHRLGYAHAIVAQEIGSNAALTMRMLEML